MSEQSPITFTTNPRLSIALHGSGPEFEQAMEDVGVDKTLVWLQNRVGEGVEPELLEESVRGWFDAETPEDRVVARVELAEVLSESDEATSELLWEASMRDGFDRNDSEQAFDAVSQLAQIAERNDDPATAAELYIDFLNWRRQDNHASDPEFVHQAFEEVIRLAERDHQPEVAARFGHTHARFTRIEDAEDEAASEGDWAPGTNQFTSWE